ncbi:hypothetical protein [Rhodopirellula bahusiensis]|uniref:hypothetical protein n=1 Tax=Rhodopirellula bahusiensis TaxID=2014065 RepID=UPI0032662E33
MSPMVTGWLRPTVLVPVAVAHEPPVAPLPEAVSVLESTVETDDASTSVPYLELCEIQFWRAIAEYNKAERYVSYLDGSLLAEVQSKWDSDQSPAESSRG